MGNFRYGQGSSSNTVTPNRRATEYQDQAATSNYVKDQAAKNRYEDYTPGVFTPSSRTPGQGTKGLRMATINPRMMEQGKWFGNDLFNNRPGPSPSGGGGGGGGGGYGGGYRQIDMEPVFKLLGRRPQDYEYEDFEFDPYEGQEFRAFNGDRYNQLRDGIRDGVAADRSSGMGSYGDARTELRTYDNPFLKSSYMQNGPMPEAMANMLSANGMSFDSGEAQYGMEADAAFRNLNQTLGAVANQNQASSMRALAGDERRFNESLDSSQRSMLLSVGQQEARAREVYEREKFEYGEEIARANYQQAVAIAQANHQGRNNTDQANVQVENEYIQNGNNTLIDFIAQGQKIDPEMLAAYIGDGIGYGA
jgi:hypothetical protein